MTVRATHHFTVDVEEVFHSTLLASSVPEAQWEDHPRRAPAVVAWLLDRMAAREARGTFFVLGWLAEREPDMVRRIAEAGHEVAAHSWSHRKVHEQDRPAFRDSVRRTREVLEDITGLAVHGFRAPSFSILPGHEWAFDILLEEGYRYDSSLFPTASHPDYGYPDAPPDPHWIERPGGRIAELPPVTYEFLGRRLPAAGGAYLRLLPFELVRGGLRQVEKRGARGTLYVHPWDLDPDIPRLPLPASTALRLYGGAARARARVVRLLDAIRSVPLIETVRCMSPSPTP